MSLTVITAFVAVDRPAKSVEITLELVKYKLVVPSDNPSLFVNVFCFVLRAVCVAVEIGLFKSDVLSTFPRPICDLVTL